MGVVDHLGQYMASFFKHTISSIASVGVPISLEREEKTIFVREQNFQWFHILACCNQAI